ncbi:MAG: LarC family nickel insertion protein [Propioniciclava sp.]
MAHAWIDITAGVAGDMLLGSLLDAGADLDRVRQTVAAVIPQGVGIGVAPVDRAGQRAIKVTVDRRAPDPPHRTWRAIQDLLTTADLPERVRSRSLDTFAVLARAEGVTHGIDPDQVHFHEVGALDAIADVVGTCAALEDLGIDTVTASPVAVGSGRVRAAHGAIPVPVPAVTRLLVGWQTTRIEGDGVSAEWADHRHGDGSGNHSHGHDHRAHDHRQHTHDGEEGPAPVLAGVGELATPTGLALVRALATSCGPLGDLAVTGVGVGAGGRDFPGWPNVVRVMLGDAPLDQQAAATTVVELAANIDDLDPRLWPEVVDARLAAGALDAWLVPIHMKKGRPAFTVHALAVPGNRAAVVEMILTRTSTLGVREVAMTRTVLDRCWIEVEVDGHPVAVKIGSQAGTIMNAAVEFDTVAALGARLGIAPPQALARANAAIINAGMVPGSRVPPGCSAHEAAGPTAGHTLGFPR